MTGRSLLKARCPVGKKGEQATIVFKLLYQYAQCRGLGSSYSAVLRVILFLGLDEVQGHTRPYELRSYNIGGGDGRSVF